MTSAISTTGNSRDHGGFTLVETIVVLAVAALLLTLLPPLFAKPLDRLQLRRSVYQLASDLRQAQQVAIIQSRETAIQINVDDRSYRSYNNADDTIMEAVDKIKLLSDARLAATARSGRVVFYPDGSSSGGHVVLTGSQQSYHVKITWISGHVSIDDGQDEQT